VFRLFHPLHLLLATLTYFFGVSLADHLGKSINPASFWLGLLMILLLQLTLNLLPEVYRPRNEPILVNETRQSRFKLRNNALYVSMASLASIATIAYILFNTDRLPLSTFYFILLAIGIILAYSTPPLRLMDRGFGEILSAVQLAYIFPTIAFTLQNGETHPSLIIAIPVTLLAFASFIVNNFKTFPEDQKYRRATFLTRLDWERVIPLHHVIVLFAYIFLLAMPAINIPFNLVAPAFLTFPFAVYQIVQLRNISLGLKPNWLVLQATAVGVFGLTTYFLTFTFWAR
jgi:1,4-dihydroxy-2-naphthoate octaprenyltransferase